MSPSEQLWTFLDENPALVLVPWSGVINFTQPFFGGFHPFLKTGTVRKNWETSPCCRIGYLGWMCNWGWASWPSSGGPFCYSLSSSVKESGGGCCQSALWGEGKIPAVDGWNPASTIWSKSNLASNGISYQPQLVQDFWTINSMDGNWWKLYSKSTLESACEI